MKNGEYQAYGTWSVTTEGDEEGRTTRQLGTHTGFLDDIAFKLADKCYYSLQFKKVNPTDLDREPEKAGTVMISFDYEMGLGDKKADERAAIVSKLLKNRDVIVEMGNYYGSVKLIRGTSPEAQARAEENRKFAAAMQKLSPEELELILSRAKS